jgi:hypothetical protein
MYVRCVFVQYAAVCHYRRFVCVSGAPVWLRSDRIVEFTLQQKKCLCIVIKFDQNLQKDLNI